MQDVQSHIVDPKMDAITQLLKHTTDKVYSLNSRLENMERTALSLEIEALLTLEKVKDIRDTIDLMQQLR